MSSFEEARCLMAAVQNSKKPIACIEDRTIQKIAVGAALTVALASLVPVVIAERERRRALRVQRSANLYFAVDQEIDKRSTQKAKLGMATLLAGVDLALAISQAFREHRSSCKEDRLRWL